MNSFIDYVVSDNFKPSSKMMESRALPSFLHSVRRNHIGDLTDEALKIWFADMLFGGLKAATAKRYIGIIHSAYKDWMKLTDVALDPFKAISNAMTEPTISVSNFAKTNIAFLPGILRINNQSTDYLAASIFLFMLYDVRATLNGAIYLKHREYDSICGQLTDILEGQPRRYQSEYVFPLHQGKKRATQISRELTAEIKRLLTNHGMRFGNTFSRDDITAMWIYKAWQCGFKVKEIRSMISNIPDEYSFLGSLTPENIYKEKQSEIICKVADSINDHTLRWFVMKLRSGIKPADINNLLEKRYPEILKNFLCYYPTKKVFRKDGKKKIYEEEPYLPNILFFRTYRDKIGMIFHHIGHLAWCFKISNTPDSPYTAISINDMKKFQMHVGKFTPDIEMQLVTVEPVAGIGDSVSIVGGNLYEGQDGEVLNVRKENDKLIYVLKLTNSQFIRWEGIEIDGIFIERTHQNGYLRP